MSNTPGITRCQDGGATVITDTRYFPIVIYTWFGTPTLPLISEYFKLRWLNDERAKAAKTVVIMVSDLSEVSAPAATIRKAMAEGAKETDKSEWFHCYFTTVPNAVLRGALTAIQWIVGDQMKPNTNVANMQLALRNAISEYERLGIEPPAIDIASYVTPSNK